MVYTNSTLMTQLQNVTSSSILRKKETVSVLTIFYALLLTVTETYGLAHGLGALA
jgi:hypothetical protein